MGHYASEMGVYDTPAYRQAEAERDRWRSLGFRSIYLYGGSHLLACGECAALVPQSVGSAEQHYAWHRANDR